ncbi:MAG TPA: DNA polymerase [Terriglobales bacterium]
MILPAMDLYLRVHTDMEQDKSHDMTFEGSDRWAPTALIVDCETTIDAKQLLNFAFYRKCELRDGLYVCIEEGIVYAEDVDERLGKKALEMLRSFATKAQTDTVRGRHARMRLYSRTDFVKKVLLPMYLRGCVIVGANLCFDLSCLALDYKVAKRRGKVWSLVFKEHNGAPDKIQPRLIMTPRNSRSAFLSFTSGHRDYEYGSVRGGRFLDLLSIGFGMRNRHYSLDAACREWGVPGKLQHKPTGSITKKEITYCRQDVKATFDLLNAIKREFDDLPIDIPPEKIFSPASLSKAFLESMGLQFPVDKFSLSNEVHGIAMQSYYGGRAECRIRKELMPVMFVDFTSEYPTCNSLLGIWDYMIAEDVRVLESTKEVREFLSSVTLQDMFDAENWRKLNFFALVEPRGDVLPVRAIFNDVEGESTNIGINPLTSKCPIWYSGPDLVMSKIQTGRTPKVIKAISIIPVGVQKGLRPTKLGDRTIDPELHNFYNVVIEGKEKSPGAVREFYKCLANAGCYGLAVEVNGKRFGRKSKKKVHVFSGEINFDLQPNPEKVEVPGPWFCPFIASWITASGRLLLAMLEKSVTDAGGSYLMCDTDSMAIVSTETGGLVACAGGEHRLPDGREAVKALPWKEVQDICRRFDRINPYNPRIVKNLLKIEDCNYELAFDENGKEIRGKQQQLYGFAISSKRYCLCTDREIIKPSEHGLGVYYFPDKRERYKPKHYKAKTFPLWVVEAWRKILNFDETEPNWFRYLSMRKLAITTPNVLRNLRLIDRDAARPYRFVISPVLSFSKETLVTSFCDKPAVWDDLEYVSIQTGKKGKLNSWFFSVNGKIMPLGTQRMRDVIQKYSERPEFKSLAPDGSLCKKDTVGLLRRRPVIAKQVFQLIGKEVDRGSSEDAYILDGERLTRCANQEKITLPKALRKLSDREISRRTGLDSESISRMRKGKAVRRETLAKLMRFLHNHYRQTACKGSS